MDPMGTVKHHGTIAGSADGARSPITQQRLRACEEILAAVPRFLTSSQTNRHRDLMSKRMSGSAGQRLDSVELLLDRPVAEDRDPTHPANLTQARQDPTAWLRIPLVRYDAHGHSARSTFNSAMDSLKQTGQYVWLTVPEGTGPGSIHSSPVRTRLHLQH